MNGQWNTGNIKHIQVSDLSLTHFNPKPDIVVVSDASEYVIGTVILHKFEDGSTKPVARASKTLLVYSQIEKESLALMFALKNFHKFVCGRKFVLQTDQCPLLSIEWVLL